MTITTKWVISIVLILSGLAVPICYGIILEILPYPVLLIGFSFLSLSVAASLLRYKPKTTELTTPAKPDKEIDDIKLNGSKIYVNLEKCEIVDSNYEIAIETENGNVISDLIDLALVAGISGYSAIAYSLQSYEIQSIHQSVLIYTTEIEGKPIKFISNILPFDKTTLQFKLFPFKQTTIYLRQPDKKYYFDVSFLFQ